MPTTQASRNPEKNLSIGSIIHPQMSINCEFGVPLLSVGRFSLDGKHDQQVEILLTSSLNKDKEGFLILPNKTPEKILTTSWISEGKVAKFDGILGDAYQFKDGGISITRMLFSTGESVYKSTLFPEWQKKEVKLINSLPHSDKVDLLKNLNKIYPSFVCYDGTMQNLMLGSGEETILLYATYQGNDYTLELPYVEYNCIETPDETSIWESTHSIGRFEEENTIREVYATFGMEYKNIGDDERLITQEKKNFRKTLERIATEGLDYKEIFDYIRPIFKLKLENG